MKLSTKIATGAGAVGSTLLAAMPAWAQDAAPTLSAGDTAWMLVSTVLVLAMILPGLALFYGGLLRTKNMLSMLTHVLAVACLAMVVWVTWGYSIAFTEGSPFFGGFSKLFLKGVAADTLSGTIPEFVFISFQMTFAAITAALFVGSLAERVKFGALLAATLIWLTIVYFPLAHMVWSAGGFFFERGALDFAGGTVVHINAGVSGLVGCLLLGKRIGYQRDVLAPHSLTMTFIGTGLLWVGWFGFNAGSALAANGTAGLAMINTFTATAAAALVWMLAEKVAGHKPSLLGGCSGVIAGLVAVTPAAGNAGPFGAIVLGAIASVIAYVFVSTIKPKLGFDDTADVFGIHGVAGIVGSIGTAFTYAPGFGGPGAADYAIGPQLGTQLFATAVAILWAGVGSAIAFGIVKAVFGLRVSEEVEREGLDLGEHGERAYNY
ncbi:MULTISPECIES: ammonium transporter [Sphingomonadales]|uniref:Ammonium transporter n=2 Tax=Edaphosphingomonas TaxID=3423724 RepID=A0A2T4I8I7_9SPHN|nr:MULTISPECIES: ammonium transporter [Sphingomonas]AGH49835.1 ammonium transporter [Sphingomonas sp. MM-1]OHT18150.1 Ammonia channel precursor [Sphingomonas haloaromaticamans]PTD28047.1 ammonium transporter [Sphingomonas fennica]